MKPNYHILPSMGPTPYVRMHDTPMFPDGSIHPLENIRSVFTQGNYQDYATPVHLYLTLDQQPQNGQYYIQDDTVHYQKELQDLTVAPEHRLFLQQPSHDNSQVIIYSTDPTITPNPDILLPELWEQYLLNYNTSLTTTSPDTHITSTQDSIVLHLRHLRRNALNFSLIIIFGFLLLTITLSYFVYPQYITYIHYICLASTTLCILMFSLYPAYQYTQDIQQLHPDK